MDPHRVVADISTEDAEQVVLQAAECIEKWLPRRGFGPDAEEPDELLDDTTSVLHAGFATDDREGIERMARTTLRPPLATL